MATKAKKKFYLVKRRNRRSEGKAIYYCRFRNPDGNLLPWKSTGATSKTDAENWAIDHLNDVASVRATLNFGQYAEGWWLPDCPYFIRKAARGSPVAPSYADVARSYLTTERFRENSISKGCSTEDGTNYLPYPIENEIH